MSDMEFCFDIVNGFDLGGRCMVVLVNEEQRRAAECP